ncbi:MAG: uncharacterized protein KVP18_002298 [Porospora cf. gigantea A]|uniref:uncharacterized protein n=1 Tax=Porospora cf. gigantea A TaxID=2853593 RepID=UPI00355A44DD|nr:MAG: hypothetical protein KVP18_002298 [Porospora cf. gigantea A]
MKLLVGVTGSVAAIKTAEIVSRLGTFGLEIKVVTTEAGLSFLNKSEPTLEGVLTDDDDLWDEVGEPVLHIELRKWADALVMLPLTANTLAKISNGLCDNLLTNVARAWDFSKPFMVFPAMNTHMWQHPITKLQLATLQDWGVVVVEPVEKRLACGDVGMGGLPDMWTVIKRVMDMLEQITETT